MALDRERTQFLSYLKQSRQRVTAERLSVFEEIFAQDGHIDAEDLLASLLEAGVEISRATVYRNLDLLVDAGLVTKHRLGRNHFLYEHVYSGQDHDHLVCVSCGRVVEFVSPGIIAMQSEICRLHGFVPERHSLEISGLCRTCAEAASDSPAAGAGGRRSERRARA